MLIQANTHLSGEMSAQEEKYWLHILSGDPMFRDFVQRQSMHGVDPYQQIARQPVCPRCERACFYHMDGIACHHCGYVGPNTHKVKIHMKEGWYK